MDSRNASSLRSCSVLVPLVCLWSLVAAAPVFAQDDSEIFGEVIDVRVINLEVVVEEDGARVTGLGPDDFELTVDGKEVQIEYFTEVSGGTAVLPDAELAAGTIPALAPGEEVGTSFLVFIDEYFSLPTDRDRLLNRMIEQLPNLTPRDRMAVVAFNGQEVDMLSSWSQSVETLTRVLEEARERPTFGLQRESERRLFELNLNEVIETQGDPDPVQAFPGSGLDPEEQQLVDLINNQTRKVVLATAATLRSFANPPGRKVMLLLSGGWPHNPAQWVVNDPARTSTETLRYELGQIYDPVTETANRLSYTIYPVDVPGVESIGPSAEDFSVERGDRNRAINTDREREEELTLRVIADETGGKALLNSAGLEAFQRVVADTRSYYWIGFTPDWKGDDADHKVRVKPKRKGLKMRTRKGYSDLSRETEVTMMVESSLLFGDPPSAAPLGVEIGKGKRSGFGKVTVPVKIEIPVGALTFLPQGGRWVADTELRVAVLDEAGNTSDIPVIPLGIRVSREPTADDVTVYETQLKLRRKKHDLVVSLYDKPSGRILSTKMEIDPEI